MELVVVLFALGGGTILLWREIRHQSSLLQTKITALSEQIRRSSFRPEQVEVVTHLPLATHESFNILPEETN